MSWILEMIKTNLSDVFVSLLWFPNLAPLALTDSAQLWELRVCAAPPRFWAGCARSTFEHWCLPSSVLSLWNMLWMGISDSSSYPGAFSMRLALLQTGNERENAGEGGLPEDTVTLRWDWLLVSASCWQQGSQTLLFLAVHSLCACQHPSSTAGRMVTLPKSLSPGAFSIIPPKLEPGCPHWAMPSMCYCDTAETSLPCSGAHVHTEPGVDFVRRVSESSCRGL